MADDVVAMIPLSITMLDALRQAWESGDGDGRVVEKVRDLFDGQDGHLLLIDKALAKAVIPRPVGADIRGHLISGHGYEVTYVDLKGISTLNLEHIRLHTDETAENLHHSHVEPTAENAVTADDMAVAKVAVKLLRKLWDARALHIAITTHTTNLVTRTGAIDLDRDEYQLLDSWVPRERMSAVAAAEVGVRVTREMHAKAGGEVPNPASVSELYEHLERMHGHNIDGLSVDQAGHWLDRHLLKLHGSSAWPNHTHPA